MQPLFMIKYLINPKDYLDPSTLYNLNKNFDLLIDSYLENKVGINAGFLSPELSEGLQQNIDILQQNDLMQSAGIGNNELKDPDQKMRSDHIYWMDKSHNNSFENEFLLLAENFIDRLNETCYTGINSYEFHYAVYEKGSFYKRHRDRFVNDSDRKFSLISYLNTDWLEEDGGQLLVYQNEIAQKIQPHSQTAVFFKSDETEHEVVKVNRLRMSVSGWLKRV